MHEKLERAIRFGETVEIIYMAKDGTITKRRINVLQIGESSFNAYCYLRKSKRIFVIDNVLAFVPLMEREKAVI